MPSCGVPVVFARPCMMLCHSFALRQWPSKGLVIKSPDRVTIFSSGNALSTANRCSDAQGHKSWPGTMTSPGAVARAASFLLHASEGPPNIQRAARCRLCRDLASRMQGPPVPSRRVAFRKAPCNVPDGRIAVVRDRGPDANHPPGRGLPRKTARRSQVAGLNGAL